MKTKFIVAIFLYLAFLEIANASTDFSTFDGFFNQHSSHLFGYAIGAVVIGAVVIFTGGLASPLVASSAAVIGNAVGSLMGLSGVAATNAGLALLGGGSLAAGGLGMAGGAALLTVALSFGTDVVMDYSINTAWEYYDNAQFIEQSKTMVSLPLPKNTKGSNSYEKAVKILDDIEDESFKNSADNLAIINKAIEETNRADVTKKMEPQEIVQLYTLQALLFMRKDDYASAQVFSKKAIDYASNQSAYFKLTLPKFIFAVSSIYHDDINIGEITENYFKPSVIKEPDNPHIAVLFAAYLDRVIFRFDDGDTDGHDLAKVFEIAKAIDTKTEIKSSVYYVILGHYFNGIKKEQQKVSSITQTLNSMIKNSPDSLQKAKLALNNYHVLLDDLPLVFDAIDELGLSEKKRAELEVQKFVELKDSYVKDETRLEDLVNDLNSYQQQMELENVQSPAATVNAESDDLTLLQWIGIMAIFNVIIFFFYTMFKKSEV